jgi:hypothetical protein
MPSVIIEGCARGADRMAERFAQENNIPLEHYPADWYRFGPSAGPRRNELMLVRGKPRLVVAFDLGTRGTADMVARARAAGVAVAIVRG